MLETDPKLCLEGAASALARDLQAPVSIDLVEAEAWHALAAVEQATPESLYERRWALSLFENVMSKLRAEFAEAGKATRDIDDFPPKRFVTVPYTL